MSQIKLQPATIAARTGIDGDRHYGAVVPPVHLTSTYSFSGYKEPRTYDYTRSGNPTRDLLAKALADLEGGAGSVITASGMAAIAAVLQILRPGDLMLAPHDCYGGTWRLFDTWAGRGQFDLQWVDFTDARAVEAALNTRPRLIWLETPSNPLLRVTDIEAVSLKAKTCGALIAVDNTFLSPVHQQPLNLGADIVVHSTTKYLNGHSDVVGGAVICRDQDLHEEIVWWANCLGVSGAPFDSYLTLRGVRTLQPRMQTHEANARIVAQWLAAHPQVARVHYPGLATHPQYGLARRQQNGFGAIVSFELHGGEAALGVFLESLRCFSLAESLGGVESLIAHPATMTHAAMSPEARAQAGIGDSLLRLSVGIEAWDDLIADLQQALARAARPSVLSVSA